MDTTEARETLVTDASGGLRETAWLAAPLVMSQLLTTAMSVVDSAIVGRLGAAELGAVGLAGAWVWTLNAFFAGLTTSVQTFVAQEHGAGRAEACGRWTWQGLAASLPAATAAAGLMLIAAPFAFEALASGERLAPLASGYMRARALGVPGLVIAMALAAFFRGIGDARTPFYATVFANVLNLGLDFGLVYGWFGMPRLGVVGAGLATAIAEWSFALWMIVAFARPTIRRRFRTRAARPDPRALRRFFHVGLPIGGQWVTEMVAYAILTTFVARMGEAQMAASHAFVQLMSLSFMQAEGLSMAAATLVGRYIGARRPALAERSFRSAGVLCAILSGLVLLLFVLAPEALIGIFTRDAAVLAHAAPLLTVGAFYVFFDAMAIVADGALRGAGDTRVPFVYRSAAAWLGMLPLAWLFAFPLGFGLTGAWAGSLISMVGLSALLFVRFRSGAWRQISI